MSETDNKTPISSNILDQIMGSQTQTNLNEFEPKSIVSELLLKLKDRDRETLSLRFGLNGVAIETLENIGKKYNLTRERVRQIEKDSLALLRKKFPEQLAKPLQLLFDTILEHGTS